MTALVPIRLPSAGCITVVDEGGSLMLRLAGEIDAETVAGYERTDRRSRRSPPWT
jgi:hypothetical protein